MRRRDWPPRRCRYELPSLARLRASAEDAEVALLCITSESPSDVNRFLESRNLELPRRVICGEIPTPFVTGALPSTFILDRTGSVMLRHVGAAKWDDPRVVAFRGGLVALPD